MSLNEGICQIAKMYIAERSHCNWNPS